MQTKSICKLAAACFQLRCRRHSTCTLKSSSILGNGRPLLACDVALHTPPTYRQLRLEGGQGQHGTSISHVAVCRAASHGLHTEAALMKVTWCRTACDNSHANTSVCRSLTHRLSNVTQVYCCPYPDSYARQCEDPSSCASVVSAHTTAHKSNHMGCCP